MSELSIRVWSEPKYKAKFVGLYEISEAGQVVNSGRHMMLASSAAEAERLATTLAEFMLNELIRLRE